MFAPPQKFRGEVPEPEVAAPREEVDGDLAPPLRGRRRAGVRERAVRPELPPPTPLRQKGRREKLYGRLAKYLTHAKIRYELPEAGCKTLCLDVPAFPEARKNRGLRGEVLERVLAEPVAALPQPDVPGQLPVQEVPAVLFSRPLGPFGQFH